MKPIAMVPIGTNGDNVILNEVYGNAQTTGWGYNQEKLKTIKSKPSEALSGQNSNIKIFTYK